MPIVKDTKTAPSRASTFGLDGDAVRRILLIGQCTLHWGRMEFGNIGNYYIIEPFIRELHRIFPKAEIRTTMQMTKEFCDRERVTVLPMELYYGWKPNELIRSLYELAAACAKKYFLLPLPRTRYMDEVRSADLVIDFSGDIWGDNANFLGRHRFFIGTTKDFVATLMGTPTVMLAGSPGPFTHRMMNRYARLVYGKFDLVTNREPVSMVELEKQNFDVAKTKNFACPAFLFEPSPDSAMVKQYELEGISTSPKPKIGFVLCGWNMTRGPFDRWPREASEYEDFIDAVEHLTDRCGATVYLMSHSNGFKLPPDFQMIHGRDFPIAQQLHDLVRTRNRHADVKLITTIYNPWDTKALIGKFDMMVSGRIHAAVAALSQQVPTVIVDYGHEPKAHKLRGFAAVAGVSAYVADPSDKSDLLSKIDACWDNRVAIRQHLAARIPEVKNLARENFTALLR